MTLLLGLIAHAQTSGLEKTPIGFLTFDQVTAACEQPNVMVGHVVAARELQHPQLQAGGHSILQTYTEVTIQRTHTLRGESAPQVTFRIPGAYRPEEGVVTINPERLVPHIGHTFGVAYFRKGAAGSGLPAGAARVVGVVYLPDPKSIPREAKLRRKLGEFCETWRGAN